MVKKTSNHKWTFNRGAWAEAVREKANEHGYEFVGAFIGVHPHTVMQWAKDGSTTDGFPYPSMTNFVLFCQEFDVDPREMWMIEPTGQTTSEPTVITLDLVNPDVEYIRAKYEETLGYKVKSISVKDNRHVTVVLE